MRRQTFSSVKVYGVFTRSGVVICVKPVEICMNNSESKKRLLALQKSKFLSVEIQDALRFAIEKLSDAEFHDAQIPKPVMANKRWSQAEENQLVESLLAGNSIELIATNLGRVNTNGNHGDDARQSRAWRSHPSNSPPLSTACPGSVATSA